MSCIYTSNNSLTRCFFITCSTINLACKKEVLNLFWLKWMRQNSCWIDVIVGNNIGWLKNFYMTKSFYSFEELFLNIEWKSSWNSIRIHDVWINAFGFQPNIMFLSIRENKKLFIYWWTVSWPISMTRLIMTQIR